MPNEPIFDVDVGVEIDRYFDDSSISGPEQPRMVVVMGGVASGKTTFRKQHFSRGYVLVDAADIFLNLSRGEFFPFPSAFEQPMEIIGGLVAEPAVSERRHIVTELIGSDFDATKELLEAMRTVGYAVALQGMTCDIETAQQRNRDRGDDDISCYYTEPYQRRWLLKAAHAALNPDNRDD